MNTCRFKTLGTLPLHAKVEILDEAFFSLGNKLSIAEVGYSRGVSKHRQEDLERWVYTQQLGHYVVQRAAYLDKWLFELRFGSHGRGGYNIPHDPEQLSTILEDDEPESLPVQVSSRIKSLLEALPRVDTRVKT